MIRNPDEPVAVVHSAAQTRRRMVVLGTTAALLACVFPILLHSPHKGSPDFHAAIEMVGAVMGLMAGFALAAHFIARGNRFHLLVGLAFFVNGAEDFVHGLLEYGNHYYGWTGGPSSALSRCIPGTYVSGRLMMAVLLLVSLPLARSLVPKHRRIRETFLLAASAVLVTAALTATAFHVPLPKFIYPDRLISRPVDFVSAILLLLSSALLLRHYRQTRETFVWWISLSIAVNVVGQVMMSFSKGFYDAFSDMAHVYKVLGYAIPLVGFSLYQIRLITTECTSAERACQEAKTAAEAKEQARREAAKLSAMISGMEEGVVFANADNVIVEINDYLCRFLGKSRAEIVGKRIEDFHHGEALEHILGEIRHFREKTGSSPFVVQRLLGEAEVILRMQPIYRDGKYDGVLLNVIDVTELVRARRRNELILSSAGEGIFGLDLDGKVTFINPAAARMFGWEPDELVGKPFHETLHHTRSDGCPYPAEECPILNTFHTGRPVMAPTRCSGGRTAAASMWSTWLPPSMRTTESSASLAPSAISPSASGRRSTCARRAIIWRTS